MKYGRFVYYQPNELDVKDQAAMDGDQIFRCPECGQTFTRKLLEGWGTSLIKLYLPPCPNCGANMREVTT